VDPFVYRSRRLAETALYALFESVFETVKGVWEDLFERRYGFYRTRLLLSWHHSGFSVHNFVTVPAGDGRALEALARYCLRNPVSLARLRWEPVSRTATQSPSPRDQAFILRHCLPARPPRRPLFGVDGSGF
jgi:hypothetical protein